MRCISFLLLPNFHRLLVLCSATWTLAAFNLFLLMCVAQCIRCDCCLSSAFVYIARAAKVGEDDKVVYAMLFGLLLVRY